MLGSRIRELRKRAKMTLDDVARELGVHKTTVSRWERTSDLPLERVDDLAGVLGVDPSELQADPAPEAPVVSGYVRTSKDAKVWRDRVAMARMGLLARFLLMILPADRFLDRDTGVATISPQQLIDAAQAPADEVHDAWAEALESPFVERVGEVEYALKLRIP